MVIEYFTDKELSCGCGCGKKSPKDSVQRLYALRLLLRTPMYINSSVRCIKHNELVGGVDGSMHLLPEDRLGESETWYGGAFDINSRTWTNSEYTKYDIVYKAMQVGFTGIGIYKTFIHIDDAITKTRIW